MPLCCIEPARGPIDAAFDAIPSKSATHRALVAASMAEGESTIGRPLDAADTRATRDALSALGATVRSEPGAWMVRGRGGGFRGGAAIDCGASGTTARFLLALAALGAAPSTIDGTDRLRERPMAPLAAALRSLGAVIVSRGEGELPLVAGGAPVPGGRVTLSGGASSQFASAILLAAPGFTRGVHLVIAPPLVSAGYLAMTRRTLERFGAVVHSGAPHEIVVAAGPLAPRRLTIEGDHSAASYLFAAAAVRGGTVRVAGLARDSLQPDARFLTDLAALGCTVTEDAGAIVVRSDGRIPPFSIDLAGAPDLAPTLCALAVHAEGACRLTGLDHLRLKESDRLAALAAGAACFGARAMVEGGTLAIEPRASGRRDEGPLDVVGDHRIAMAFAVAGLRGGVLLSDGSVVAKSYPSFWEDFARLSA
jgi:3-phosphoshikimate 1-carboxyvinyltransferase